MDTSFIGIDWGTSNRRAYFYGADGKCVVKVEDEQGTLAARGHFAESLQLLLEQMNVASDTPVLMSGMVGSTMGWKEVPYLDPKVPLLALPQNLAQIAKGRFIVPGYCQRNGLADVMRGEETQLLGLVARGIHTGWVILPGTHSKWVYLENGVIRQWSTYMTGELFALLSQHSTLSSMLAAGNDDDDAFLAGVALAQRGLPLSQTLFSIRASVVSCAMPAGSARNMASGLLIGTEFAGMANSDRHASRVTLLASTALQQRYQLAASTLGVAVDLADTHALFGLAMQHLYSAGACHAA